MTFGELFSKYFPQIEVDDELREHVLWAHTGYPGFYSLKEGQTPLERLEEQVAKFAAKYPYGDCQNSCEIETDLAMEEHKRNCAECEK